MILPANIENLHFSGILGDFQKRPAMFDDTGYGNSNGWLPSGKLT
jgi:hypothetical protein